MLECVWVQWLHAGAISRCTHVCKTCTSHWRERGRAEQAISSILCMESLINKLHGLSFVCLGLFGLVGWLVG